MKTLALNLVSKLNVVLVLKVAVVLFITFLAVSVGIDAVVNGSPL